MGAGLSTNYIGTDRRKPITDRENIQRFISYSSNRYFWACVSVVIFLIVLVISTIVLFARVGKDNPGFWTEKGSYGHYSNIWLVAIITISELIITLVFSIFFFSTKYPQLKVEDNFITNLAVGANYRTINKNMQTSLLQLAGQRLDPSVVANLKAGDYTEVKGADQKNTGAVFSRDVSNFIDGEKPFDKTNLDKLFKSIYVVLEENFDYFKDESDPEKKQDLVYLFMGNFTIHADYENIYDGFTKNQIEQMDNLINTNINNTDEGDISSEIIKVLQDIKDKDIYGTVEQALSAARDSSANMRLKILKENFKIINGIGV